MRTRLESALGSVHAWRAIALGLLTLLLAACSTAMGPTPSPTAAITPSGGAAGQRAPVKIALLLPLGGMGETAAISKSMKQAAEMALFEVNDPNVQLITKDDGGTAAGGRAAADAAIKEGAEIILGPLFSQAALGAAPVARQANVPILSFSNDKQVAGNGVYLMSFLAEAEIDRVVSFAARQGKRRFAALIPDNAYGNVAEPAFRSAVQKAGGTVVIVERYPPAANGMLRPAKRVVEAIKRGEELLKPVDALFLPGGQDALPQIGPVIAYNGLDTRKVKLLGTGAWDFPSIGRDDAFVGGWYASPDPIAWRNFAERFAKTFGNTPPRIASVAYDAVSLAIGLSSNPPGARFTVANLTRPNGFSGVDGIVRFSENGLSERGLAVLEVQKFGTAVADPAPTAFQPTKLSAAEQQTVR
jgi:ABC-type branched-subunit amino acid transport system substrate-binding protein